jgi:hypothetical protein
MALSIVSAPSEEPVSVEELRVHLRLDGADDSENTLLGGLISAARARVETMLRKQIVTATYDLFLDSFPLRKDGEGWGIDKAHPPQDRERGKKLEIEQIEIPLPPLQSVTSVKYTDANAVLQTIDSSLYSVDSVSLPGRIIPTPSSNWPSSLDRIPNAVEIRFVAGYGLAVDVPESIKLAIKFLAAHWYENREATSGIKLQSTPMGVDALLDAEQWGSYV